VAYQKGDFNSFKFDTILSLNGYIIEPNVRVVVVSIKLNNGSIRKFKLTDVNIGGIVPNTLPTSSDIHIVPHWENNLVGIKLNFRRKLLDILADTKHHKSLKVNFFKNSSYSLMVFSDNERGCINVNGLIYTQIEELTEIDNKE
jgi:hypothetical protein